MVDGDSYSLSFSVGGVGNANEHLYLDKENMIKVIEFALAKGVISLEDLK